MELLWIDLPTEKGSLVSRKYGQGARNLGRSLLRLPRGVAMPAASRPGTVLGHPRLRDASAKNLPRLDGFREALEFDGPEIAVVEKAAGQPARAR